MKNSFEYCKRNITNLFFEGEDMQSLSKEKSYVSRFLVMRSSAIFQIVILSLNRYYLKIYDLNCETLLISQLLAPGHKI